MKRQVNDSTAQTTLSNIDTDTTTIANALTTLDTDTKRAAAPTLYTVTLTNANQEYSQALPANCRGFDMQPRTNVDVRWAVVTGKVAGSTEPFATMKAGAPYNSPPISQAAAPSTIFLASGVAGTIVEIVAWV